MAQARQLFTFSLWLALGAVLHSQCLAQVALPAAESDTCRAGSVALGKALFFDTKLSRNGKVACSSCHDPERAFTDGKRIASGIDGRLGTRNAPSLVAVALQKTFSWDGRRAALEDQVLDPFTNPLEMDLKSVEELEQRVQASRRYARLLRKSCGDEDQKVEVRLRYGLSAYLRSIPLATSAYDRYLADPAKFPLSYQAKRGLDLFQGRAQCSRCHSLDGNPAALTDHQFHHSGVGWTSIEKDLPELTAEVIAASLSGTALGDKITSNSQWAALGRFVVTRQPADLGAFRTPSLRNVAVTAPYMHDGSISTIAEAVDYEVYYRGLAAQRPITLTDTERLEIVAFLLALSDANYVIPDKEARNELN